jgi:hypothetical protein
MAKIQEIFRDNPELLEELKLYFNPKPEIVKVLPDPRTVSEFKTVFIKQNDGSYKEYRMLNGSWYEVS